MLKTISVLPLACLLFVGCSSTSTLTPQEQKYQQVKNAARTCAEEVKAHTLELNSEEQSADSTSTSVDYDTGDGQPPRSVESRTSPALDNGVAGNAWTACMKRKDALVPELKI